MNTPVLTRHWYAASELMQPIPVCDGCWERRLSYTVTETHSNVDIRCTICVPRVMSDKYQIVFHTDGYTVCYSDRASNYLYVPRLLDFVSQLIKL